MTALVLLWAFAEGALFFLVADVPISAVGLLRGPRTALRAALLAAPAAALGGLVVLAWAGASPESVRATFEALPAISPALVERAAEEYAAEGTRAMVRGSFRGTPYKLYALAAGLEGVHPLPFLGASILARLPRFLVVALFSGLLGRALEGRTGPRRRLLGLGLFWVAFYGFYFSVME